MHHDNAVVVEWNSLVCTVYVPLELNTSFVLFGDWSLARMTEAAHKREGVPRCKGHAVVSYLWTGCVLCVYTHYFSDRHTHTTRTISININAVDELYGARPRTTQWFHPSPHPG